MVRWDYKWSRERDRSLRGFSSTKGCVQTSQTALDLLPGVLRYLNFTVRFSHLLDGSRPRLGLANSISFLKSF